KGLGNPCGVSGGSLDKVSGPCLAPTLPEGVRPLSGLRPPSLTGCFQLALPRSRAPQAQLATPSAWRSSGGRGPEERCRNRFPPSFPALALSHLPDEHTLRRLRASGCREIPICTLIWPSVAGEISWDVSFVTLNFLVPGLLIVISYSKILQITKASRRRLTMSLAYSESHQIRVSQQDVRLFRTLFLLMISFFIMWSPIIITILLILIQNFKQNLVIWPSLFFWVMAFTFANSAVNPILYNMSLFRNEWRKFFHCFFFPEKGAMFTDTSVRRNDLSVISS
uniref:Free fatty acid receptor 4 n=1 Tax=Sus scrofa TaxID=9823 RepID=A0A8D2BWT8_PIG